VEELGIDAHVGERVGIIEHAYTHFRVTVHAFECRLKGGEPIPVGHTALRWITLSQTGDYPMGKVDREIARLLLAQAKG
jgi:A/G-specific adenine glycosylase